MYYKNEFYSYKNIIQEIYSFFGLSNNLKTSIHSNKTYWLIEISSLDKLNLLINYLNEYSLLTAKQNDYTDWLKGYQLIINNKHF